MGSTLPPLQFAPDVNDAMKAGCGLAVTFIMFSVKSGVVVAPTAKLISRLTIASLKTVRMTGIEVVFVILRICTDGDKMLLPKFTVMPAHDMPPSQLPAQEAGKVSSSVGPNTFTVSVLVPRSWLVSNACTLMVTSSGPVAMPLCEPLTGAGVTENVIPPVAVTSTVNGSLSQARGSVTQSAFSILKSHVTVTVSPGQTTLGVTEPGNAGPITLRLRVQQQRVNNMVVLIIKDFSVDFMCLVFVSLKINDYLRKEFCIDL